VGGIAENYVYTYVYMTPEQYERLFGMSAEYQVLLVTMSGMDEEAQTALGESVLDCENVSMITLVSSIQTSFRNMVVSIDYIVLVLIICAGLLAFVVLYNLMNINITERQRELATIKVLGFYEGEVGAYVYRETLILSLLGTALGLFLGIFLHAFVVRTAEVDVAMFGRDIYPMSFVYAALLTMLFSVLVCLVMFPKLRKIDMVESLKSIE
jgi:putative ABC transport system permease protein